MSSHPHPSAPSGAPNKPGPLGGRAFAVLMHATRGTLRWYKNQLRDWIGTGFLPSLMLIPFHPAPLILLLLIGIVIGLASS